MEIYQKILLEETLPNAHNAAIVQLKLLGLVVNRNHRLQVYNPIYQAVFDRDWIARQLSAIRPYAATRAIIEAARQASKPTRNNLQQALSQEDFSFDGATGKVAFKYGERVSQQVFLVKILPSNSMSDNLDFVFLP